MAKDKLQKGIEGTKFKPKKQVLGFFGDSEAFQKKYYNMTSAAKRDAHKKGRSEGKKFRAKTFVDRETGTLRLDTVSNRKRYGKKVYKAPDVSYVEPRKLSKGGLKGNQKKLDKNNNNRIDSEDFKILRGQGKSAMKAKKGKLVPLKKDPTRPTNPFAKKALDKGKKIIGRGGRIGAAATILGLAGAGAAKIGQTIGRKLDEAKKRNKKMGGGMMKKPGYKYGKMIEDKFKKYARSKETQLHSKDALKGFDRAEKRSVSETMGEYKKDIKKYRDSKLKRLTRFSKGGGADTGSEGEDRSSIGVIENKLKRYGDSLKRLKRVRPKLEPPKRGPMKPLAKKMGGGMMNKPMGYKSGTSVKVKCKLGRNKPTKMY